MLNLWSCCFSPPHTRTQILCTSLGAHTVTHGGKQSLMQSPAFTQTTANAAVVFPCFHSHLVLVTHWNKPKHTAKHSLPRQCWVPHTALERLSLSTPFASTKHVHTLLLPNDVLFPVTSSWQRHSPNPHEMQTVLL